MKEALSVVICTHNPRRDYLDRVLNALKSQTLALNDWELLLVDNASEQILSLEIDLRWHPQGRHIREEKLGLTPARLRGIKEAHSEIIIFVDDDNILDPDYLEIALQISEKFPVLGAWGGQIIPEFEEIPPDWTKPYWWMLAIFQFDKDHWSNLPYAVTNPCGAGMCVRRSIATKYADLVSDDPRRMNLDRKGNSLVSCGDTDLAFTACDVGLGLGRFVALKLTHIMPSKRLQEDYLLRLFEANGYSSLIMESFRSEVPNLTRPSWQKKLRRYLSGLLMDARARRFRNAHDRGKALAVQEILDT